MTVELQEGWDALRRAAWEEARAVFERALARAESAEAREGLSWATWWTNEANVVLDSRERAYGLYRAGGDARGAARMAVWLASDVLDFRGEPAVSSGWLRRAHRLLAGHDLVPEHGWLAVHEGTIALDLDGDTTTARRLGRECAEIGRRLGSIDLEMLGLALEGQAAVHEGDVSDGMKALDEAAAAAVAGELHELVSVGWSCCSLIKACEQVRDHDRAAQWSQQTTAFAERVRFDPWFGVCRSFYATVLMWRGRWDEAERELVTAREMMAATRPPWAAEAVVRLGELRICQGRFDEAERLFREVDFHPRAQLGLAEVALAHGEASAAVSLVERVLRAVPREERTGRVPVLETLVRARARDGDVAGARAALAELAPIAEAIGTMALRASIAHLSGLVHTAEADHDAARRHLEDAVDMFSRCGAAFDAACARAALASSLAALGESAAAVREERLASESLLALGVVAPAIAIPAERPVLSTRELDVVRLICDGLSDKEIAGRLHLSEHTVHRHVSNIRSKLGAPSRAAAVAIAAKRQLI